MAHVLVSSGPQYVLHECMSELQGSYKPFRTSALITDLLDLELNLSTSNQTEWQSEQGYSKPNIRVA